MYAIKIIGEEYTAFHLADEVHYKWLECKDKDEFWDQVREYSPTHQIGNPPSNDLKELTRYVYLTLYEDTNRAEYKSIFVLPTAWVYIMQDGKTIEVININVK